MLPCDPVEGPKILLPTLKMLMMFKGKYILLIKSRVSSYIVFNTPFTLDEGADMVWLPLKYFEKLQKIWRIFNFYGGIARTLSWDCKSVEVRVHMYCGEGQ